MAYKVAGGEGLSHVDASPNAHDLSMFDKAFTAFKAYRPWQLAGVVLPLT